MVFFRSICLLAVFNDTKYDSSFYFNVLNYEYKQNVLRKILLLQIFAHYEIMDHYGVRVSEGQKASFCLEDNDCDAEVSAVYDCENYGDQGITPGCKVIAIYSIIQTALQGIV